MEADTARRWLAHGLIAALIAAALTVMPPAAPKAHAWTPCNLPGGDRVCKWYGDAKDWVQDNTPIDEIGAGIGEAIDFATDPLGYMEQKLRGGTQKMFNAFGEDLTGRKPKPPKKGKNGLWEMLSN